MSSPTKELVSYDANCHCGAVRFSIHIPPLTHQEVISCNCSICTRNGYLMVYPARENIKFHTGFDQLVDYRFGDKTGTHKFCTTCGSSVSCEFEGHAIGINVRMIQDIDVKVLKLKYVDGKSMEPHYQPPHVPKLKASSNPDLIPYPANCHCGLVTYTVPIPSLVDHKVVMCNCSICTRNGYLNVYPHRDIVIFHQGHDQLRTYSFGNKVAHHKFCPRCGSSIYIDLKETPLHPALAINVVMLQDVNPREFKLKGHDGKTTQGPEYTVGKEVR